MIGILCEFSIDHLHFNSNIFKISVPCGVEQLYNDQQIGIYNVMLIQKMTLDSQKFAFIGEEATPSGLIINEEIEPLLNNRVDDFVLTVDSILCNSNSLLDFSIIGSVFEIETGIENQMLILMSQILNYNSQFGITLSLIDFYFQVEILTT